MTFHSILDYEYQSYESYEYPYHVGSSALVYSEQFLN